MAPQYSHAPSRTRGFIASAVGRWDAATEPLHCRHLRRHFARPLHSISRLAYIASSNLLVEPQDKDIELRPNVVPPQQLSRSGLTRRSDEPQTPKALTLNFLSRNKLDDRGQTGMEFSFNDFSLNFTGKDQLKIWKLSL